MKKLFVLLALGLCNFAFSQQSSQYIRINQIGFLPFAQKTAAVVNVSSNTFEVLDENKKMVFSGKLSPAQKWISSGESVQTADFSTLTTPGLYTLYIPNYGESYRFEISNSALFRVNNAILKAFYFNRASIDLEPKYASIYERKAGHYDTEVVVHPSAAGPTRKAGDIISTPKGWYDAGDYNKYIVNSGITTATLLLAYENYKSYFDTLNTNIPESGNNTPDILDEIRWNLDWMMSMQDPADGGVYTKTTSARFCGMIMPDENQVTRYVVSKSTAASLNFSAVFALTYRIYKDIDPTYANTCLVAAEKSWKWYETHSNIPFYNPEEDGDYPKITTGGYSDRTFKDEKIWAASELYIATLKNEYLKEIDLDASFVTPVWYNPGTLALYSLYNNSQKIASKIDTNIVKERILEQAERLQTYQAFENPYKVPAFNFSWGSNGVIANQGVILLYAFKITKNLNYYNAALSCYDYILGRNATEFSFVTEYGEKCSHNIHHRPSQADKIAGSIPGFLAGGPNGGDKRDCFGSYSQFAAKAYYDGTCSFTTNEIAINWQAPLTFLAHGLVSDYINWKKQFGKTYVFTHTPQITCSRNDTAVRISVMSDTKWTLKNTNNWFEVVQEKTSGNSFITVRFLERNNGDSIRNGSFAIISNNKVAQTIHIAQKGKFRNFRIEAEDFISMDGVQTENTLDLGGGLNVGWINNGDFMKYKIDIPITGSYILNYRVACYNNSGELKLVTNGYTVSQIKIAPTGGWQEWATISDTAYFDKGIQEFTLQVPQGGFNINYIDFNFLNQK